MESILTSIQMVLGVLLIVSVLLQQKGGGVGMVFGGGNAVQTTRRGSDLFLHRATIGLSIAFFAIALILLAI